MKKPLKKLWPKSKKSKYTSGPVVDLYERYKVSELMAYDSIPFVEYDILLHGTEIKVGECDLRLKRNKRMYYYGDIGYNVIREYRGNHYALEACKLLFKLAHDEYGFTDLLVTCNPDNLASYKTLQALKGRMIEIADIPIYHELYMQGERRKCVFVFDLNENGKD